MGLIGILYVHPRSLQIASISELTQPLKRNVNPGRRRPNSQMYVWFISVGVTSGAPGQFHISSVLWYRQLQCARKRYFKFSTSLGGQVGSCCTGCLGRESTLTTMNELNTSQRSCKDMRYKTREIERFGYESCFQFRDVYALGT